MKTSLPLTALSHHTSPVPACRVFVVPEARVLVGVTDHLGTEPGGLHQSWRLTYFIAYNPLFRPRADTEQHLEFNI